MTSPNNSIFHRPAPLSQGGFFSGGFGRGLLGGFIGAGLFGLLFGHGLFGGLGGGLSILGLALQIGLLFLLFKFVMGFIRGRWPAAQSVGFDFELGPRIRPSRNKRAWRFSGLCRRAGKPAARNKARSRPGRF